jgi:chaperonin cofactor prefoldin
MILLHELRSLSKQAEEIHRDRQQLMAELSLLENQLERVERERDALASELEERDACVYTTKEDR